MTNSSCDINLDSSDIRDRPPEEWPRARRCTPEFLALNELLDKDDKIKSYINRLFGQEPIRQHELKEMLSLVMCAYFDLHEKCELALNSADYARKEGLLNRRHSENAVGIAKDCLQLVEDLAVIKQKPPSANGGKH